MKATYGMEGKIIIIMDSNSERLVANREEHYLPCAKNCGRLLSVRNDVVSILCDACFEPDLDAAEAIAFNAFVESIKEAKDIDQAKVLCRQLTMGNYPKPTREKTK